MLKKLFHAKNETRASRREQLKRLIAFIRETKMLEEQRIEIMLLSDMLELMKPGWGTEDLERRFLKVTEWSEDWPIRACRLLAVARMRQMKKSKTRKSKNK